MEELDNIKTPLELLDFMSSFKYSWMDKKGNFHNKIDDTMYENYSLMSPSDVVKNKCGICMDQVQLEKYWFKKSNYNFKAITIQVFRDTSSPGHAFIIYEENKKWYWFENAWSCMKGIHSFDKQDECIAFVLESFKRQEDILEIENIIIEDLPDYPYHISYEDMDRIESGIGKNGFKKN